METRARHVLIGAFTIGIVVAAMLFGLWLAKSRSGGESVEYEVIFGEAVAGLAQGSGVQYSGIKVGEVVRLTLDPNDPRKVHARIRVGPSTPIKQDTRARLSITGITGGAVIQLSGGSPQSPPLQAKDGGIPVIIATLSPLSQLASNGEELMTDLSAVLHGARNILSDENAAHISNTLAHLETMTEAVAGERNDIRVLIGSLGETSRQATAALRQASAVLQRTNGMLGDRGERIAANTEQLTASLAHTTETLDKLLDANQSALDQGLAGIGELGPAVRELRTTLASFQQISRRLQDNPSAYLLGREKTREFSP